MTVETSTSFDLEGYASRIVRERDVSGRRPGALSQPIACSSAGGRGEWSKPTVQEVENAQGVERNRFRA